jgi:hypothetical protein
MQGEWRVALFDFTAAGPDETTFFEGELLYVTTKETDWSFGRVIRTNSEEGIFGYFPTSYTVDKAVG